MVEPYVKVTDHVKQGLALLIEQYKNKPKAIGLITAYLNQVQDLEDAISDLYNARQFKPGGAFGVYLDRYGKLVGALRNSADDLAYYTYIQAQIAINKSSGTIEDFLEVARLLTGDYPTVREVFPAGLVVEILVNTFTTDQIRAMSFAFHAMVVDGVRLNFIYPPADSNARFTFDADPTLTIVDAFKYGWGSVTDAGTGGEMVAVS